MANYSNLWTYVSRWKFSNWIRFPEWRKTTNKKSSLYLSELLRWRKTVLRWSLFKLLHTFWTSAHSNVMIILFVEMELAKGCIFVMFLDVIKCMVKLHICVLILDGTLASDLLFAIGNTVAKDSLDRTNFRYNCI